MGEEEKFPRSMARVMLLCAKGEKNRAIGMLAMMGGMNGAEATDLATALCDMFELVRGIQAVAPKEKV